MFVSLDQQRPVCPLIVRSVWGVRRGGVGTNGGVDYGCEQLRGEAERFAEKHGLAASVRSLSVLRWRVGAQGTHAVPIIEMPSKRLRRKEA